MGIKHARATQSFFPFVGKDTYLIRKDCQAWGQKKGEGDKELSW